MNTQQREAFERLYTEQTGLNPPVWVEEKQAFLSSAAQFAFAQWQAAQKVPDRITHEDAPQRYGKGQRGDDYASGWNDCRQALLTTTNN